MNQSQINQIQGNIDKYFQTDISGYISAAYLSTDVNAVVIGQYTAKEFLSISNKVFNQFREEVKTSYIKALPFQYQFHNEFGGGDLHSDMANFISYIESNQFPNALVHLSRLIHYQAVNGFWEKSKRKYFRHSEESVNDEKERIELVSKQLDKSGESLNALLDALDSSKEDLVQFTNAKQKELSEIESLVDASRNHNAEITDLHSTATSLAEKITALLDSSNERKEESTELNKQSREELDKLRKELEVQAKNIGNQNSLFSSLKASFDENLELIESKTAYFMERNAYLDDLIGREVGASLFETFKQRKGELRSSITFWAWVVPITAIATILWIFFLFGNGDLSNLGWQVIFVNSLKALPAIGLLLFAISQYTKERNFQEEYAFKSAVALTINSYADQLKGTDNKDKLILDSVSTIYETPIPSRAHKESESKSLLNTAKELTEVAKSIISKN